MAKTAFLDEAVRKTLHIERGVVVRIQRDIRASGSREGLSSWIRRAIDNELARREGRG